MDDEMEWWTWSGVRGGVRGVQGFEVEGGGGGAAGIEPDFYPVSAGGENCFLLNQAIDV